MNYTVVIQIITGNVLGFFTVMKQLIQKQKLKLFLDLVAFQTILMIKVYHIVYTLYIYTK